MTLFFSRNTAFANKKAFSVHVKTCALCWLIQGNNLGQAGRYL
jgi:hypothetical protein